MNTSTGALLHNVVRILWRVHRTPFAASQSALFAQKAVSSRGTRECAGGGGGVVKPARDGAAIGCGKGQRVREAHHEAHALRALGEVAASRVAGAVAGRKVVLERGVAHAAILALAVDVQRGRARLVPVNTGHGRRDAPSVRAKGWGRAPRQRHVNYAVFEAFGPRPNPQTLACCTAWARTSFRATPCRSRTCARSCRPR